MFRGGELLRKPCGGKLGGGKQGTGRIVIQPAARGDDEHLRLPVAMPGVSAGEKPAEQHIDLNDADMFALRVFDFPQQRHFLPEFLFVADMVLDRLLIPFRYFPQRPAVQPEHLVVPRLVRHPAFLQKDGPNFADQQVVRKNADMFKIGIVELKPQKIVHRIAAEFDQLGRVRIGGTVDVVHDLPVRQGDLDGAFHRFHVVLDVRFFDLDGAFAFADDILRVTFVQLPEHDERKHDAGNENDDDIGKKQPLLQGIALEPSNKQVGPRAHAFWHWHHIRVHF
ncbi:hypothetical protein CM49_03869 [Paenibacillus sp. P1XP2]|nr:hypothetical protein CM49_03869 [Paenibacillus sp. P1XP2]